MYSCFGNIGFLTEADNPQLLGGGDREADNWQDNKMVGWDEVTYPGTLGRFLTVQVLRHLGQRETSH